MNKNFIFIVIGQIISLFGNSILRFTLPLYLLRITGSISLFGIVSAISFIPLIIMSLIGGVIADRKNKRNIMVFLDFFTAFIIFIYTIIYNHISLIPCLIITLIILYGIQGTYQPTVQSSIPLIVSKDKIMQGNSIINLVNSLANFSGPIIGGILFGIYGINPILIVSIICFLFSAILELFIIIPFKKITYSEKIFSILKKDLSLSFNFMIKEKPILWKSILIISLFNLFMSSMLIVGIPSIFIKTLKLSDNLYGITQGILGIGSIFGGIITGILNTKLNIKKSYYLLLGATISIFPMIITLIISKSIIINYIIISIMGFSIMTFATMFSIQMITFVQIQTPTEISGKVISCLLGLSLCAMPIGQALYGILFQNWISTPWIVLIISLLSSLIISFFSKSTFQNL
ncbi:MFS transporter [Oceanotoga sp. DSM 15011]|uniref:MFS transporter n=1 Tax=Oceanotoga sp. DSM 15011 TaxID=2984951 RepID=UPI0021F3D73C|nr:MFS transporter [Oceanotoga sp. DSM 15011]UYP01223.1 MFS transporter [Oceanotoga sp. DSM 15011]